MLRRISAQGLILFFIFSIIQAIHPGSAVAQTETGFPAQQNKSAGPIQIINSYGYDNDWPRNLSVKIKKELGKIVPGVPVHSNFTNIAGLKNAAALEKMQSVLGRMQERPGALVFIGEEAWLAYRQILPDSWNRVPVVIGGVRRPLPDSTLHIFSDGMGRSPVTGIYLNDNAGANLNLIASLIPEIKNILYISEETGSDDLYIRELEKHIAEKQSGLNLVVAKTLRADHEYLRSLISNLNRPNTAILINNFHSSGDDTPRTRASGKPDMPVFLLRERNLYGGSLFTGGVYESVNQYAEEIAELTKNIYEGRPADAEPFRQSKALHTVLNNKSLGRLRISPAPSLKYTGVNTRERSLSPEWLFIIVASVTGTFLLILLVILDIRSRRKKKKLHGELNKYTHLFEDYKLIYNYLPIGIVFFDKEGNRVQANPEAEKLLKTIWPLPAGENLFSYPFTDQQTKQLLTEGKTADKEMEFPSPADGRSLHYRWLLIPLRPLKGPSGILMLLADNTKPRAERKFRDHVNEVLQNAIESSNLGIAEFNLSDNSGTATESWYKNLRTDPSAPVLESFRQLEPQSSEKIRELLEDLLQNRAEKGSADLKVLHTDGSFHWVKVMVSLKTYDPENGQVICGALITNIDAQKQKEEQLTQTYENMLQTTRTKNSFISNLSHEIRTPLNAVVGFAELLIESADEAEQKELLKYIEENNENLLRTITDIIDLSKIESRTAACPLTELDLKELCTELAEQTRAGITSPAVQVSFAQTQSCIVFSNKNRLRQIMEKFLSNAVKFTSEGTIEIGYKQQKDLVYLFVKDTGPGIPAEKQPRLFNRFEKMDNDYRGLGLGLPMAASIVKNLLKGNIGFETQTGKGTTMWITIPSGHIKMQPQMGIKDKLENATMGLEAGLKTILIAEDNENNYQLLKYMLKGKFKILHAKNGQEAVNLFQEHAPDLILMDIKMPVMDGYEATAAIREISSVIPVIAVTAYAFDQDSEQVSSGIFNEFITKPVREQDLMKAINTYLK